MMISGYYKESINEGEGLRAVIFISGCKHYCKGCFNPETWNFEHGEEFTLEKQMDIINDILCNPLLDGITLCGGDPFYSAREVVDFVRLFKSKAPNLTVWAYTGFMFEQLLHVPIMLELLQLIDVLIDGRFIEDKRDLTLKFRGSSNQRIIDVQKSLESHNLIICKEV
ncbi:anaerobic ribonucleoside-triphosphate reductase activating protein [Paenibacillus alvei]|uniref:anaerobic ribonucleoside-triphosphate reductase activating protein n=1 Tax=Paenibacillus alvei TaxID=44250 RepID=UPI00227EF539|nr:anaerobic ribonucleoside-triphosphate reductase activating protein [Paenibacillus alvei]MCY9737503.1 anaerobic ribonucleoside-triphosphate reductase activating protein [Paenibacillus alvei]